MNSKDAIEMDCRRRVRIDGGGYGSDVSLPTTIGCGTGNQSTSDAASGDSSINSIKNAILATLRHIL